MATDSPKKSGGFVRFTPWKLLGVLFVGVSTTVVLLCISAVIPPEETPRIDQVPNGSTVYTFESMRQSVLFPVGIFLSVFFAVLSGFIVPRKKEVTSQPTLKEILDQTSPWKYCQLFWRGFISLIGIAFLLMILLLLIVLIVLNPLNTIRVIQIDQDTAEFHSLLRSWTVQRAQIVQVRIDSKPVTALRPKRTDVRLTVDLAGGRHLKTAQRRFRTGRPNLEQHMKFMIEVKDRLSDN